MACSPNSPEAAQLAAMLVTFFPGRVPLDTARAWLLSVADRNPRDIADGIQAMAEHAEHPSCKALCEAVAEVVRARCERENSEAESNRLAAWIASDVDHEANRAKLAAIVEAVKRKASREEIEAIVGVKL